ncbi:MULTISPECIES: DUF1659 domain-containing protein [unclassified Sporolactobacillus]|uniref:DUF1659 domain-containing protein n=1 Tax=unclassified Sporolactobacillus TaxID=2628533 RepID=UPI002368C5A1|nr:DUF1659 domain-containing protein [Sporolactobacillus sp. CQH2019]MDD9147905.1 DUF1659 domain-containing protein [Sporolactobacillus sp. CQH2019]
MATSTITESAMVLTFDNGLNEKGEPAYVTKSFRNIKPNASYDALLAIAQKLGPLQQHALISVERNDTAKITA